ncbi:PH domain-containing protein [Neptunicella sp. SCSIO 80796]|uniref:PH domain-containing protein n=1 Tax=Neptunicella plasticusilytica TaxID=3117012 RepID=UPI003A4E3424
MQQFSNQAVSSDSLPQVELQTYEPLADNAPWESFWGSTIFNAILLVGITIFLLVTNIPFNLLVKLALGLVIGLMALNYWHAFASHPYKGVRLREQDILFKKGMFWRSVTIVPFNRIQHLETHRGPIERKLGLSSLKFYTAGGAGADLKISGLEVVRAEQIKHHVLKKAGLWQPDQSIKGQINNDS